MCVLKFEEHPPTETISEIQSAYSEWAMEVLDIFIDITGHRRLHPLRLCFLRHINKIAAYYYKLAEYYLKLNKLEVLLYGIEKDSEQIDRYFTVANAKNPADWCFSDFNCLELIDQGRVINQSAKPH